MRLKAAIVAALLSAGWLALAENRPAADLTEWQRDVVSAGTGQTLPGGDLIIQRVMNRSAALAAATNTSTWAYDKAQVMVKLDGNAKVKEREEKLYRVQMVQGIPFAHLIKIEGRALTDSEVEKENQREAAFQKRISGRDPKKAVAKREAFITTNMVARFQITTTRRDTMHGRQTLVLSFEAKPGTDDNNVQERLLSRLAGTLWVDEETADVARLEVHLTKEISLGMLGVLGTIKNFQMDIVSKPMTNGIWLPEKSTVSFSARMFLSRMQFQMEETSSNYMQEPAFIIVLP
jgi:hypothetical protein